MSASVLIVLASTFAAADAPVAGTALDKAESLLLRGNYAEAVDIYTPLAGGNPVAAVGLARCFAAQGELEKAKATLAHALGGVEKPSADHAVLHAELAGLAFERGDYPEAQAHVDKAIALDSDQLHARYLRAELHRVAGRVDEAQDGYAWLMSYYNDHEIKSAESLRWIGLAAARYAGWNRLHNQFQFLVNELYPDALKLEPGYWPARLESGNLFLEKHNQAGATREILAGLELNPNAAELHLARAALAADSHDLEMAAASVDRAIQLNPAFLEGWLAKADLAWSNFDTAGALRLLADKAMPLNPLDEKTLGRVAACYLLLDGFPKPNEATRFSRLVDDVSRRNPHAGEFYSTLASALEGRNKQFAAKHFFRKAMEVMPRQVGPEAHLGLLAMRTGEETEAKRWLDKAFEADPFDIRVKNTLEVLEVLDEMKTLETAQVVIKYDGQRDELLARYVARHLDAIYPALCEQFGYRPPGKPLVEIFSSAKGLDGHKWFSARLVGLPFIGTVAASTGRMVAMVSPSELGGEQRFNWARVLKHELVHVVTLQQTHFNIPHWYTEGLAVLSEDIPRRPSWDEMLLQRVPAGKTLDLRTINAAFIRPREGGDQEMAYCQAELYVQFMISRWGPGKQRALLAAYAAGMETPDAVRHVFGISIEEFERRYGEYLREVVAGMSALKYPSEAGFSELVAAHRDRPQDADAAAELAYAYLQRGAKEEAIATAEAALAAQPRHQLATYVIARLRASEGKTKEAVDLLEACLDPKSPQPNVLNLLAGLKLKAQEYNEAVRLYSLGQRLDPANLRWMKSLGKACLLADDDAQLAEVLGRLAALEPDHLTVRKKLAEMAMKRHDYAAAERWAREAIEIDVADAGTHKLFAEALVERHNHRMAIEEFQVAELNPAEPYLRYALADACLQAGEPAKARAALERLLELDPSYPGARLMLEELKENGPP